MELAPEFLRRNLDLHKDQELNVGTSQGRFDWNGRSGIIIQKKVSRMARGTGGAIHPPRPTDNETTAGITPPRLDPLITPAPERLWGGAVRGLTTPAQATSST